MSNRIPSPRRSEASVLTAASDDNVKLPPVPFVTIRENVAIHDLPGMLEESLDMATLPESNRCALPILAYFVGAGLPQKLMPLLPVAPERLFLCAADPISRNAVMAALAAVEIREPNYGKYHPGRLEIGDHTPLKEVFCQMAVVPMTVFSMTFSLSGGAMFFIRSPFTIANFFDELRRILLNLSPHAREASNN